jgi:hypothetical protein
LFAVITSHFYIWFSCKIFVFEFWQWNAAISLTIIFFINMYVWIAYVYLDKSHEPWS